MTGEAGTSEADLLAAAAGGDPAAWNLLIGRALPSLWAMACSYELDERDAADVCRVVSVRLAQSLHEVAGGDGLARWLAQAGRRECRRAAAEAARRRAPVIDLREAATRRAALVPRGETG